MENLIKQQAIVDIDTSPKWEMISTGICLLYNKNVVLLLNLNEDNLEFDGYTVLRGWDFEQFRAWDENEVKTIKNNNSSELISNINLDHFSNFQTTLENLKGELVAIFLYGDTETYYVGKVVDVSNKDLLMLPIDEDSNWLDLETIKLKEVSYIGFGTKYEKGLLENLKK
jgi:hypothetical protein